MASDPDTHLEPDPPDRDDAIARAEQRVVNTQGGDYAEGSIDKRQGTFVEGDLTLITEDRAYSVAGLPNPYPGLRTFSAAERDIFAGRERIVRALVERLSTDDGDVLLFIVGASGSGKSSLVRAGLLPALAQHLGAHGHAIRTETIDHPGRRPATVLARVLHGIHTPSAAPAPQLLVVLIDQFEEIFSQAAPDERNQALTLLADLAVQPNMRVRIIATMRSDFLPQLVADPRFELAERRKVVLRAMHVEELREAILRPIQTRYPDKRIEPSLLERLASDAAVDAAYLPLLQVTLEDLWRGGELRLSAYRGLAEAIQRRADAVYAYRDYDGLQQERRTADEQQTILNLFLDLVRVSLDEEQRDVRWRRPLKELTLGNLQRERLIADLATARLLHTDQEMVQEEGGERASETVDIVHEALLGSWPTLRDAISQEREMLRRRERFILSLDEWLTHKKHTGYLLTSVHLGEAEALKQRGDGIFLRPGAQEFYDRSVDQRVAEQAQQLRLERRARRLFQGLAALLAVLLVAALIALLRPAVLRTMARSAVTPIAVTGLPVAFEPFEVTNARYKLCVDAGVCQLPVRSLSTYFDEQRSQDPVTGVDALQGAIFCVWIDRRLPTLSEWAGAALPGDAARWSPNAWQEMRDRAYLSPGGTTELTTTVAVGSRNSATPEGIHDLIGNVWEWSSTVYNSETNVPEQLAWDGRVETVPEFLVVSGSSFRMTDVGTEAIGYLSYDRQVDIGIRCVESRVRLP